MRTKTAHFTEEVVLLTQNVVDHPVPTYPSGKYGYADRMILAIQGLKKHLDLQYRKLIDVLYETLNVATMLGLTAETLPCFSTFYAKKPEIPLTRWYANLDWPVDPYVLGDVQAMDATGMYHIQASQHYA